MNLKQSETSDITKSLNALLVALNEQGIYFADEETKESTRCCISHHYRHLKVLNVNQISIDPYKIVTWFAFDLARREDDPDRSRNVLRAAIAVMFACLTEELPKGDAFAPETLNYLLELAHNEVKGDTDHGIGKNGLFTCFHCAQKTKTRRT